MKLWEQFLSLQEKEFGKETVTKWLRSLKVLRFDALNIYLEAKDSFHVLWFEEHIRPRLGKVMISTGGKPIRVHVITPGTDTDTLQEKPSEERHIPAPPISFGGDYVSPLATFASFIAPEPSEVTYKIFCELTGFTDGVFKAPNLELGAFNPIYLYGPRGSGKTHLLMAATAAFNEQNIAARYVKAETFTEHVVRAIRSGHMQEFRSIYRSAHVLLIDDIHLFARKAATQEEFFHTFNTLHTEGKQLIFSALSPPRLLDSIEERLVSRFEWGINLSLEELSTEDMKKLLHYRLQLKKLHIKNHIEEYLLASFSGIKSFTKALDIFFDHVERKHPSLGQTPVYFSDLSLVESWLKAFSEECTQEKLSPSKIVKLVADAFGLKTEDILGKSQSRECALPRQITMYLIRHELKMPFLKIGHFLSRDHSTVMSGVKVIEKAIESSENDVISSLHEIKRRISS